MSMLPRFVDAVWRAREEWERARLRPDAIHVPPPLWEELKREAALQDWVLPDFPYDSVLGIPVKPDASVEGPEFRTHERAQLDRGVPGEIVLYRRLRIQFTS